MGVLTPHLQRGVMWAHCTAELGKHAVHDSSSVHISTNHSATRMPKTTVVHGGRVEEQCSEHDQQATHKNITDDSFSHKRTATVTECSRNKMLEDTLCTRSHLLMVIKKAAQV